MRELTQPGNPRAAGLTWMVLSGDKSGAVGSEWVLCCARDEIGIVKKNCTDIGDMCLGGFQPRHGPAPPQFWKEAKIVPSAVGGIASGGDTGTDCQARAG